MPKHYIAIDIGGTRVRAAIFKQNSIHPEIIQKINTVSSEHSLESRVIGLIKSIAPPGGIIEGIGIAVPGLIDHKNGKIINSPNIKSWVDFPLKQLLEDELKTPVCLGNDANLASVGEWKFGAARGHRDVLYLTVSTGIGSGVISNNQLITGSAGIAGELGHVTIFPDGPVCSCGKKGHLEAISSGTAIAKWFKDQVAGGAETSYPDGNKITAKTIADSARTGDPLSLSAFNRAGRFLGIALAGFVHSYNPSIIILGGGVMQSGDLIMDPIKEVLMNEVYSHSYTENLKITLPELGDEAGIMGALHLIQSNLET